jgi:hypothetical protein
VRVERVGLEHHRDVAILRRALVDALATDGELTGADVLETGDHVERGRLSAARRPHQDDELAVGDGEGQILDRGRAIGIALGHVIQHDFGHRLSLHRTGRQTGDDPSLED